MVLCPPPGHDYARAHRAIRQAAETLSRTGCAALRFDFSGCGDSAGDFETSTLGQWVKDVAAAVDEARDRSGGVRLCLLGVRLGAALAALASDRLADVEALIVWDPVVRGDAYVRDMARLQAARVRAVPGFDPRPTGGPVECLGFAYPPALLDEIGRLDLTSPFRVRRILTVETDPREAAGSDRPRESLHASERRAAPGPWVWDRTEEVPLVAHPALLASLAQWVTQGASGR